MRDHLWVKIRVGFKNIQDGIRKTNGKALVSHGMRSFCTLFPYFKLSRRIGFR